MSPWTALDLVRGLYALPHVWDPTLGEHLAAFKVLCLEKTTDLGGCIPCPSCDCYHRIIVRNDNSGAIAACRCQPPTCPDFPLTIEQATFWEVNQPRLGRAIARALGCPQKLVTLSQPNTLQFGSWSSNSVPVILTIQHDKSVFRRVIAELGLTLGRPYILFAPTNADMDARSQELLSHAKAGFFTLDATVRLLENGTLEALKPAAELFAAFTPESDRLDFGHLPSATCHSPTPRYALRKGLGVWELFFDGRRALLKHERGIFYVHWLLYHPDETPIHAIDLMAKVPEIYRQQLGLAPLVDPSTGKVAPLLSGARLQERSLALDDRQSMRAIFKKEEELQAILDSDGATEPEKAEALRELEEIIEFLKHHARRSKNGVDRAARTVRQAIVRFHEHLLQTTLPQGATHALLLPFAAHIEQHLLTPSAHGGSKRSMSGKFTYQPPSSATWT